MGTETSAFSEFERDLRDTLAHLYDPLYRPPESIWRATGVASSQGTRGLQPVIIQAIEVLRPGAYALTGRKLTIKMAMAAAGNLGPLAWPENSVLIRRVGRNQEQMIPLNIENIMRGLDAEIYLKPNDVIAVGTAWQSTLLAVMRNAFRMTYGFGFIYDRNFADNLEGDVYPNSKRFKGW